MKPPHDSDAAREQLQADVLAGRLSLGETIRRMRRILGLTQADYARWVGVAPRALMEIERGTGNPTLKTLARIGHPYGFELAFRPRRSTALAAEERIEGEPSE